jgi:hypothetical protein
VLQASIAVRLLAISLMAFLWGCATLNETKLHAPTWFGLERMAPNVYVSREVTDQQRGQLLASIRQARKQVTEAFGSIVSDPEIYACADRGCYASFNGYGDGRVVAGGVLLLPKSFIPEAIAHEWSHVELHARVGRSGYRRIPMWFHEGLAVAVSRLPAHSDDTLRRAQARGYAVPQDVRALGDLKVWSDALRQYQNGEGLNVVYAAAGREVRGWLECVGSRGLPDLIEALNSGEQFVVAYDRIAQTVATQERCAALPPR